jgi:nitrite reductase/ring-hydroxylating ferredoxin subunit
VSPSRRTAHVVAAVEDIPEGGHRVVAVSGREYGVFNVGGTFHAIPNRCLHQGGPLCRGRLGGALVATAESGWRPGWTQEGEVIRCPWHQLEFNVTTGRCLADPRRRLATVEVLVEDGQIKLVR